MGIDTMEIVNRIFNRIVYLIKQLYYLEYRSENGTDGERFVSTWEMQFGEVYNHKVYKVA